MIASGTSGTCTWKIEDNWTLTVVPTNGSNGYFLRDWGDWPWESYKDDITSVIFRGSIRIYEDLMMDGDTETGNATILFGSWTSSPKLKSVYGLSSLKGLTNTYAMFYNCSHLTSLDLSGVDVSGVTNMNYMFKGCESLTSLDLSSFNTSKVENMNGMFENCRSLSSLNLSSFNTSKISNMGYMFQGCESLTSLDLSSFNTSKVERMYGMFHGCGSLVSLNLSSFNTSNIDNMNYMFEYCKSLTSLDLSSFDTSKVTTMNSIFEGCESLESLQLPSSFETANVTSMNSIFENCKSLTSLDLSYFNTSKVTDMSYMFNGCYLLSSITFGNYFEISSDVDIDREIGFGKGVNQDNGILVPDDKAFLSLSTTERVGHWTRNVSETYEVNAYRAEEGTADEGGSDVIIKVRWSTNAQTTDRTLSIFKKLNSESTYPSSAIITKTLSGNSGTEVLTLTDVGSEAYDFKVQFYDGTNTFVSFPGVPATIELIVVSKTGDVKIAGDLFVRGFKLIDLFYPIGSYYETSNSSFNPNTAMGGTWVREQIEDDYVVDEINNGIWIGRKWASGKLELYMYYSGVPTGGKHYWTSANNILYGYRVEGFVFPQGWKPLNTTYNVTVNWNIGSGFCMDSTYGSDTNGFKIYALATQANITNVQAKVLVTGYWKSFGSPTKYRWHRTA